MGLRVGSPLGRRQSPAAAKATRRGARRTERRRRISPKKRFRPEAQRVEDERYLHPVGRPRRPPEPRRAPSELSISASENDWVGQPGEPYNIKYGVGAYTQFDEIYPTHRQIGAEADATWVIDAQAFEVAHGSFDAVLRVMRVSGAYSP
jgi:hypothetical protein